VANPAVEAARELAEESLGAMHRAIVDAPPELLNWRPAGDDTNSLAVIAVHGVTATRFWLSLAIMGTAPDRDRPAEFRTMVSSAQELLSIVNPVAADCRELLRFDGAFDHGAVRVDPRDGTARSAAWTLIHAVSHLHEHVAQAELTRQVWDRDCKG
jgi:DinB superfamily